MVKKDMHTPYLWVFIILSLLIGALIGYLIGQQTCTNEVYVVVDEEGNITGVYDENGIPLTGMGYNRPGTKAGFATGAPLSWAKNWIKNILFF